MTENAFQNACDQFSDAVDETQFERFRFSRDEAPKLADLVTRVNAAFEGREDIVLAEEGGSGGQAGFKRFLVKVHGQRTVAIAVMLKDGQAILGAEPVERSSYTTSSDPVFTSYDNANDEWIEAALGKLISEIRKAD